MNSLTDSIIDLDYEHFGWSSCLEISPINKISNFNIDTITTKENNIFSVNDINDIICFAIFLCVFLYCALEEILENFSDEIITMKKYSSYLINYIRTLSNYLAPSLLATK